MGTHKFGIKMTVPTSENWRVAVRPEWDISNGYDFSLKFGVSKSGGIIEFSALTLNPDFDDGILGLIGSIYRTWDFEPSSFKIDHALVLKGKETPVIVGGSFNPFELAASVRIGLGSKDYNVYYEYETAGIGWKTSVPADPYRGAPEGFSVPTSAYSPADGQRVFDRGVEALEGPEATGLQGQVHSDSWWSGATAGDIYEAVNDPFLQARAADEFGLEFPPEFRIGPNDPLWITIDPSTFAPGTPVMRFMAGAQGALSVNLPSTVFSRFLDSLFGPANLTPEIKHPSELSPSQLAAAVARGDYAASIAQDKIDGGVFSDNFRKRLIADGVPPDSAREMAGYNPKQAAALEARDKSRRADNDQGSGGGGTPGRSGGDSQDSTTRNQDGSERPILLDLDGDGIHITELSRSTTFMDAGGMACCTGRPGRGLAMGFCSLTTMVTVRSLRRRSMSSPSGTRRRRMIWPR
ncbi:hypothetical protein [Roseobacter weihaiensis]|uniref:hypothetical protein n=1 Tax=Roseobacter weihaiensis TaxID=2763262 RepID=UPI001D0B9120|nr:hypothetical protein [Roseobacter sp. H9]